MGRTIGTSATRTVAAWQEKLRRWQRMRRARHALAQLDDDTLRDVGLTRTQAASEARRPFWR